MVRHPDDLADLTTELRAILCGDADRVLLAQALTAGGRGGVGYLAGRLGSGSDVPGFDDATSADHDFGCRLTVLVDDRHAPQLADLDAALSDRLPDDLDGWPVRFSTTWDGRPTHKVDLHTVCDFARTRLGFDLRSPLSAPQGCASPASRCWR